MKISIQNLGKVSITCNGDWEDKEYDRLCLVNDGLYATYISKKPVPAGTSINNRNYWQPVAIFNKEFKDEITNNILAFQEYVRYIITQHKEEVDEIITEHKEEVAAIIAKHQKDVADAMAKHKSDVDTLLSNYQNQINNEINRFENSVNTTVTNFKNTVNKEISDHKTDITNQINSFESETNDSINDFKEFVTNVTEEHQANVNTELTKHKQDVDADILEHKQDVTSQVNNLQQQITSNDTDISNIQTKLNNIEYSIVKVDTLTYKLVDENNTERGIINIPQDTFLDSASFNPTTNSIDFVFNTASGKSGFSVNISSMVDTYTNGNGIALSNKQFSIKIDTDSEGYLTVSANGLKLSGISNAINAVQTSLDNYKTNNDTEVSNLKNRVNSVEQVNTTQSTDIENIKTSIENINKKNTEQDTKLDTHNLSIANNTTDISNIKTSIDNINTSITNIEKKDTSQDTEIDNLKNSISGINGLINSITGDITTINNNITTINSKDTQQDTKITDLEGRVKNLEDNPGSGGGGESGGKNYDSEIAALQQKDTSHDSTLSTHTTAITNLQNKDTTHDTQIKALQEKDTSHDTSISNINTSINNINTKNNTQDSALTDHETRIKALEDAGGSESSGDCIVTIDANFDETIAQILTPHNTSVDSYIDVGEYMDMYTSYTINNVNIYNNELLKQIYAAIKAGKHVLVKNVTKTSTQNLDKYLIPLIVDKTSYVGRYFGFMYFHNPASEAEMVYVYLENNNSSDTTLSVKEKRKSIFTDVDVFREVGTGLTGTLKLNTELTSNSNWSATYSVTEKILNMCRAFEKSIDYYADGYKLTPVDFTSSTYTFKNEQLYVSGSNRYIVETYYKGLPYAPTYNSSFTLTCVRRATKI